jgi:hypothetical protein
MRSEEIDAALHHEPMWEPPPGFARAVAATAARSAPDHFHAGVQDHLIGAVHGVRSAFASGAAMVEGFSWALRQYWTLFAR